jgi:hypothetical protein
MEPGACAVPCVHVPPRVRVSGGQSPAEKRVKRARARKNNARAQRKSETVKRWNPLHRSARARAHEWHVDTGNKTLAALAQISTVCRSFPKISSTLSAKVCGGSKLAKILMSRMETDHCAWMASQADSRVAYPGRDSSVFSKLLHAK